MEAFVDNRPRGKRLNSDGFYPIKNSFDEIVILLLLQIE